MCKALQVAAGLGLLAACGGGVVPVGTSICASGQQWVGGDSASAQMHPGVACIACHTLRDGPRFTAAGTVFTTFDAKDDCGGAAAAGLSVVITDATGATHTLPVNDVGNFYLEGRTLALPYSAKVVDAQGGVRQMQAMQQDADCNVCHTATGAQMAPGRIVTP